MNNLILLIILSALFYSCSITTNQQTFGLLSNHAIEGKKVQVANETESLSSCLHVILGVIPIGNFNVNDAAIVFDEELNKKDPSYKGMANVELATKMTFYPLWYNVCQEITGQPISLQQK